MTRMIDLIGQKFGRLTVVSRSEKITLLKVLFFLDFSSAGD